MLRIFLKGFMRLFPTFPMENSLNIINSFIEGAKKIWDAFAGPRIKNYI